jgi:hypothetical protein
VGETVGRSKYSSNLTMLIETSNGRLVPFLMTFAPCAVAHFAAMAAQTKLKTSSPFLDSAGSGQKRPRAKTSGLVPARAPKGRCFTYHNTGQCPDGSACSWAATHHCKYCSDSRAHAHGTCPSNPNFKPPLPPVPLPRTTQDNRCPGRWRSFPLAKVEWIEHLLQFRPLRLLAWQAELRNDEDREFLLYVVEHGLSLSNSDSILEPFKCSNYKSAYAAADQVDDALKPDIALNRIFRPFRGEVSPFVHALGAVPKTETSVRVIHDHSRPLGRSLNCHAV